MRSVPSSSSELPGPPDVRPSETMKSIRRWGARLALGLFAVLLAALLLKDRIVKSLVEQRLRKAAGVEVQIGKLNLSLFSASLTVKDFRVFNPAGFGDAMLLHLPEISFVLDWPQARTNRLHFHDLKLRLSELNLIKNRAGLLNLETVKQSILANLRLQQFGGIDSLTLTLEKVSYTDQQQPANSLQLNLDVNSETVTNLQTEEALKTWLNAFLLRIAIQQGMQSPGT